MRMMKTASRGEETMVGAAAMRVPRTVSAPNGIRIRVSGLKGRRPGPLDDGGAVQRDESRPQAYYSIPASRALQSRLRFLRRFVR